MTGRFSVTPYPGDEKGMRFAIKGFGDTEYIITWDDVSELYWKIENAIQTVRVVKE